MKAELNDVDEAADDLQRDSPSALCYQHALLSPSYNIGCLLTSTVRTEFEAMSRPRAGGERVPRRWVGYDRHIGESDTL